MLINKIRIKNFKSIRDSQDIDVTKLFALVGKNNCGKSAIVDALQAFWRKKGKDIELTDFHKNSENEISIKVSFSDETEDEKTKKYQNKDGDIEIDFVASKADTRGEFHLNGKKVQPKEIESILPELLCIPAIRNPENEMTGGTNSFLKDLTKKLITFRPDATKSIPELEKSTAKELSADQLNALLEQRIRAKVDTVSTSLSTHFQSVIEDDSVTLKINPESNISKAVELSTILGDPYLGPTLKGVDILECGTGLQSMAILALLQTFADQEVNGNYIFLIEEPEVYLHPEYQHKMFSALRAIAAKTQVIYTTHSPIMISDLWADDSIKLVKRENGETVIHQVDIKEIISELGIRYDDVLNPKVVVFVEGPGDVKFYELLTKRLYPSLASQITRRIKFISTDGFRSIHAFALMKILNSDNVKTPFYLIADNDGYAPEQRKKNLLNDILLKAGGTKKAEDLDRRILISSAHELEGYFLLPDVITRIKPDVGSTDQLKQFFSKYREIYNEGLKAYREDRSKNAHANFKQIYRPSLLLEANLHSKRAERIQSTYKTDEAFMGIRTRLANAWASLGKSVQSRIENLFAGLNGATPSEWDEPSKFIRKIMSETE